jgi:peptide chain release factor 2
LQNCRTIFDPDVLKKENEELSKEMAGADFWKGDHREAAQKAEKYDLNMKIIEAEDAIAGNLADVAQEFDGEYHLKEKALITELENVNEKLVWLESQTLFSGKYDESDAYLFFHVGAGGVDAADWNEMLLAMYLQYTKRKGWETEILSISAGDEAGIKNATVRVSGNRAYGYLKAEAGVHRLVRQSPFNAQSLRQTSFALVEVLPDLGDVDVELDESDLKMETFRASGHGGQSVNTTDSAVRITHVPSGISVANQNERSQMQNKESAMKLLKQKLFVHEQRKRDEKERSLKAATASGDFGHQIRSYVLHPYQQIKDHRSDFEEPRVDKILKDGDLDAMIISVLISNRDIEDSND